MRDWQLGRALLGWAGPQSTEIDRVFLGSNVMDIVVNLTSFAGVARYNLPGG